MKLTTGRVRGLGGKPGKKDWQVSDDEQRGLRVRVGAKAAPGSFDYKVYLVRYSIHGMKRTLPIAACSAIALDEARRLAPKAMGEVADRKDPVLDHKARRQGHALTLGDMIDQWIALGLADRSASYRAEAPRTLRVALAKRLNRPAKDFVRTDAIATVDELVTAGKPAAARAFANYGSALYGWAVGREKLKNNPFTKLPTPKATKRERTLDDAEIRAVWNATAGPGPFNAIVRMLIVTGQRLNEVAAMPWTELDPGLTTWTLPAERAKNNAAHIVPLNEPASAIIAAQPRMASSGYVFPAARGRGPMSSFSWAKEALDKACGVEGWTLHDLRRTFATQMQKLGVKLQVVEALLNHVSGSRSGIVGVYQRHDYAAEKRAALDKWGEKLMAIVEGREAPVNVTPLRKAASLRQ
jgi:integrase